MYSLGKVIPGLHQAKSFFSLPYEIHFQLNAKKTDEQEKKFLPTASIVPSTKHVGFHSHSCGPVPWPSASLLLRPLTEEGQQPQV